MPSDVWTAVGWTAVTAIVTYSISHSVAELAKWYWNLSRLRNAAVSECLSTLNKMKPIADDITHTLEGVPKDLQVLDEAQIQRLPSGFVISPPTEEISGLISIGFTVEATLIIHFLDRWRRFRDYESRYAKTYDLLVKATDEREKPKLATAEYSHQVLRKLRMIRFLATELSFLSCRIFRQLKFPCSESALYETSIGRWENWAAFDEECTDLRTAMSHLEDEDVASETPAIAS